MTRQFVTRAAAVLVVGVLAACGSDSPTDPNVTPDQQRDLDALRRTTASYVNFQAAQAAGYAKLTECMADASGGVGYPYGQAAFIDAEARLREPEILMYEPQPDGSLRFVGIEFVVPLSESATAPSLFGLPFHKNEAFQLWVLHVWLYKQNPSGMFSDWNPTVSCSAAR